MQDQEPLDARVVWTEKQFEDIDREIARLATICKVRLLDPAVVERVLHHDESVCGARNPLAFRKLHEMLMMHYAVREHAFELLGPTEAQAIIDDVVARIRERFARLGLGGPGGVDGG